MLLTAVFVAQAGATTGQTPLAKPPRYRVSRSQVAPYLGRFRLAEPSGNKLITAGYSASYNSFGYPEGTLAVYTHTANGEETNWVGTTYEYHATKGRMLIDVISPANQVIMARLSLSRLSSGRLTGSLEELQPGRNTEKITLTPVGVMGQKDR